MWVEGVRIGCRLAATAAALVSKVMKSLVLAFIVFLVAGTRMPMAPGKPSNVCGVVDWVWVGSSVIMACLEAWCAGRRKR